MKKVIIIVLLILLAGLVGAVDIQKGTTFNPSGVGANYTATMNFTVTNFTVTNTEVIFYNPSTKLGINNTGNESGNVSFLNLTSPYNDIYNATNEDIISTNIAEYRNLTINTSVEIWVTQFYLPQADELRLNYTAGGVLTGGQVIECRLLYPNASIARPKVNLSELDATGWYNYSGFYTFKITDPAGTYVLSCENLNQTFTKTQNLQLYSSGTCGVVKVSRTLKDKLEYTINETFINARNETILVQQEAHNVTDTGSDTYAHTDNGNQYNCVLNYNILAMTVSTDYSTYNYLENVTATISQNISKGKMVLNDIVKTAYSWTAYVNKFSVNSTLTEGTYDLRVWRLSGANLNNYWFNNESVIVTNDTKQNVNYLTPREKNVTTEKDICPIVNLSNFRNDTAIIGTWTIQGYGANATCLVDVTNQAVGNYSFNITTTPTDGLNAVKKVSYNYTISPYINDPVVTVITYPYICSGNCYIYYNLTDDESDPADITIEYNVRRWGTDWYPAWDCPDGDGIFNLTTSPTGIKHLVCWDSEADVGPVYISGIRIRISATDSGGTGTADTTNDFIVDNSHGGW